MSKTLEKRLTPCLSLCTPFVDKTVAVVGNAESLLKHNHGNHIDSFDTVCRFNLGATETRFPESTGIRTDVAFFNGCPSVLPTDRSRFEKVIQTSHRRPIQPIADGILPKESNDEIADILGVLRPSSGALVLHWLSVYCRPSRIVVFGFDFKTTKTYYHTKEPTSSPHDWSREREYFSQNPNICII